MASKPLEIEGKWEDILRRSGELAGRRVRVQVLPEIEAEKDDWDSLTPAERFARSHRQASEMEAKMRLTSGEDTQRYIREGRSGGMYGMEPIDD